MRGSAATLGRRGRAAVDALRGRLRNETLPPLLAVVLAGAGGYVAPAHPLEGSPVSAVALSSARGLQVPGSAPSIVLAAPERALEALRIVAAGAQPTADGAVLYAAYLAAVEGAPAGCHLSASVLAALGQAEPGPLGDTERPRALAAAVAATADSLCAHGRDLARPADLRAALLARTGSPLVVRLVLTLKARYDMLGLGLVGAPGPVLVPLLLEQATALVADPYGPAAVYPSPVRRGAADGGDPPESAADVREPTAPTAAQVIRGTQEQAPSGSAAAAASVPVVPTDQSAHDEGPSALPESASPDAAPESASPDARPGRRRRPPWISRQAPVRRPGTPIRRSHHRTPGPTSANPSAPPTSSCRTRAHRPPPRPPRSSTRPTRGPPPETGRPAPRSRHRMPARSRPSPIRPSMPR